MQTKMKAIESYHEKYDTLTDSFVLVKIDDVPVGDFFRMPGKRKVYVRDTFSRQLNRFTAYEFNDINHSRNLVKGSLVEVGFEF